MDLDSLLSQSLNSKLTTMLLQRMYQSSTATHLAVPDSTRRAFASQMRVDARVAIQGAQNMQDAAALVTVAQTDVTGIKEKLNEMKEIAIEMSTKDTLTASDFASAQDRLQTLAKGIVDITGNSSFNGIPLLNGKAGMDKDGKIILQAGNSSREQVMVNLVDSSVAAGQLTNGSKINFNNLGGLINVTNQGTAKNALDVIDKALNYVSSVESRYSYDIKSLNNMSVLLMGQADIFEGAMKNHQTSTPDTGNNADTTDTSSKTLLSDLFGSGSVMNIIS